MMKFKTWLKFFFIISFIIIGSFSFINYYIDPLWNFSHQNRLNQYQEGFDERLLKTNYVKNRDLSQYDTILLGSSRSTFISQNDFDKIGGVFNYAVASMRSLEYQSYIDFFIEQKQSGVDYIIIGADFFDTNEKIEDEVKSADFYIKQTNDILYKYKSLFSQDTFKYTKKNFKSSHKGNASMYYDRKNIKYQLKVSEEEREARFEANLIRHVKALSKDNFIYDKEFKKRFISLVGENQQRKFIVFTSPITADLIVAIAKDAKRLEDMKRWLRELVEVFGEVHHFYDINSITTNLENYPDDDHYYPYIGTLVANKIAGIENPNIPSDFGILLNQDNLENYLKEFEIKINTFMRGNQI